MLEMGYNDYSSSFMGLFLLVFIIIIGILMVEVVRGIGQWNKNNHSPRLNVLAKVVSKRMQVSYGHHVHDDNFYDTYADTYYYATFEVESGDRIELLVSGKEYGLLSEGDEGMLSFQGTRYQGFERK